MESLDKAIECVFQSLLTVEEVKDQILEHLGMPVEESAGATPSPEPTKLDGRIHRLENINTRIQEAQVGLVAIQGELDKI